jgi:hypothetical protein
MPEVPLTPAAPETWPCPCCRGLGNMADGGVTFACGWGPSMAVVNYSAPTPCWLCRGKRRVLVLPLPDEGAAP